MNKKGEEKGKKKEREFKKDRRGGRTG